MNIIDKIRTDNRYQFALYLLAAFLFRLFFVQIFSTNGDPVQYVRFSRILQYFPQDFFCHHHSVRFPVIFAVTIFRNLFMDNPYHYVALMLIVNMLQFYFLFKLTKTLYNERIAYFTTTIFILFPIFYWPNYSYNMQIYPGPFEILFILTSVYYSLQALNKNKLYLIIISAILMFFAWQTKITTIFFLPAMIFILIKKPKFFFLFFGLLGSLFILETMIFNITTEHFFGKISVILLSHLSDANESLSVLQSPLHIFARYGSKLKLPYKFLIYPFFIMSFIALYNIKKTGNSTKLVLLVITYSYLIPLTFAVKSVSPLQLALPFNNRYLNVVIPFVIIFITGSIINKYFCEKTKISKIEYITLISVLLIASTVYIGYKRDSLPLLKIHSYNMIAKEAVTNNIPFFSEENIRRNKDLEVLNYIFIADNDSHKNENHKITINNRTYSYLKYNDSITEKIKRLKGTDPVIITRSTPFALVKTTFKDFTDGNYKF
ncbi:MAG: glycosyltransferase family 39 protein [Spirochaetes bacterium]|jgi:hypothetical protein|nr:glycosyltransferase family 39 protein [Spirochaetota bacterium]